MYGFYDSPLYPTFMINWSTIGLWQVRGEGHPQHWTSPGTEQSHTPVTAHHAVAGDPLRKKGTGKGQKGQSLQWHIMTQKEAPCPALGGSSRCDMGHQSYLDSFPPFLLPQGMAVPELEPEWVRTKSAPHNQVMNVYFVLSLLKKTNTGWIICSSFGLLMAPF